jgi:hypothetical protein
VRVELTETIPTGGIWLPTQALAQDIRGLWSVYGITPAEDEDGTYRVQPKAVEILHQESAGEAAQPGARALVRGTLQGGDRIVASGVHRLVPDQRVRPLN